jgi:hypothetical protein
MPFDEFVRTNPNAAAISSSLQIPFGVSPKAYLQRELFELRNRIAHWGFVDASLEQAERCQRLAVAIVAILRVMNKEKYAKT